MSICLVITRNSHLDPFKTVQKILDVRALKGIIADPTFSRVK